MDHKPHIIDVRIHADAPNAGSANGSEDLRDQIVQGLSKPAGQKTIPTMLLYDEVGLKIYDRITTEASEYYLFPAEEEILKNKADEIVKAMHSASSRQGSVEETVVELGAG